MTILQSPDEMFKRYEVLAQTAGKRTADYIVTILEVYVEELKNRGNADEVLCA